MVAVATGAEAAEAEAAAIIRMEVDIVLAVVDGTGGGVCVNGPRGIMVAGQGGMVDGGPCMIPTESQRKLLTVV